jgi:hypothetical protein
MTVVVSIVRPNSAIMANDSAVSLTFSNHTEYETGPKAWFKDGVGGVTTWGARDGNNYSRFLRELDLDEVSADVETLAGHVHRYLTDDYRPSDAALGDVGFHIGGFTRSGEARLYHSFWNPRIADQKGSVDAGYVLETHVPGHRGTVFMYNGRHDLAETVINTLFTQLRTWQPTRIRRSVPGYASVAHLALRFATEITPEVGPPFYIHIMNKKNNYRYIRSEDLCPLEESEYVRLCDYLGISTAEGPDDGAI